MDPQVLFEASLSDLNRGGVSLDDIDITMGK